jgi:hypothetical protein
MATLAGTWRAARDDGSQFELALHRDGTFHWTFEKSSRRTEYGGGCTLDGNVLALEDAHGGSLIGKVTLTNDQKLNFRLLGAPQEDQGLTFSK